MKLIVLASVLTTVPALAQQAGPMQVVTGDITLEKNAELRTPLVIKAVTAAKANTANPTRRLVSPVPRDTSRKDRVKKTTAPPK